MRIDFHKQFDKNFSKLTQKQKIQFKARLLLLVEDSSNPVLRVHELRGTYSGYKSMDTTGNIRAIFTQHSKNHIEFVEIGTHSQLYK